MRYIVVMLKSDASWDFHDLKSWDMDVQSIIPCDDLLGVSCAIGMIHSLKTDDALSYDWSVFELVDGVFAKRAIVFNPDGRTVKEIV